MDNLYAVVFNKQRTGVEHCNFFITAQTSLVKYALDNKHNLGLQSFTPVIEEYKNINGAFYRTGVEWTIDMSALDNVTPNKLYLGFPAIRSNKETS